MSIREALAPVHHRPTPSGVVSAVHEVGADDGVQAAPDGDGGAAGGARRLKVLISAYSCGPHRGSEPGVGWNWVLEMARTHDVWVVTSREFERAITEFVAAHPAPNVRWTFHDLPRRVEPTSSSLVWRHVHYYAWQLRTYRVVRRLHRTVGFDVLHHVTLAIYWRPSLLAFVPAPLVWGPVGGGDAAPKPLRRTLSARAWLYEFLRDGAQVISGFDPLLRLTAQRAAVAVAATPETAARLRALGARNVQVLESVGLTDHEIDYLGVLPSRSEAPFRVLSVGNLIGFKGFHLGVAAFARLQRTIPGSEYWIVGDGPERRRLEALARALGVEDKVRFWGAVPRARVLEMLRECDVVLHPSLHDSGGFATLEAMGAGRPVVCLDVGGPGLQVTDATGIKVPPGSPEQVEEALTRALIRLGTDPDLRSRMAVAARERARTHYRWRVKSRALTGLVRDYVARLGRTAAGRVGGAA